MIKISTELDIVDKSKIYDGKKNDLFKDGKMIETFPTDVLLRELVDRGELDEAYLYDEDSTLYKTNVMRWTSVKEGMPTKDGQYCTYLQTGAYDSIVFTQFMDGEFMSSSVTHWMEITKPCD